MKIIYKNVDSVDFRKLPLSWTISSLRNFFSKTQKIPVGQMKLMVKVDENSPEEEISEDHKTVGFYVTSSESIIIVDMK